jgi:hypothetical protein
MTATLGLPLVNGFFLFVKIYENTLTINLHSFYLNLCFSGTFYPIFGSKLRKKGVKCTGYTISATKSYVKVRQKVIKRIA